MIEILSKTTHFEVDVFVELCGLKAKVHCMVFVSGNEIKDVCVDPDEVTCLTLNGSKILDCKQFLSEKAFGSTYVQILRQIALKQFSDNVLKYFIAQASYSEDE